MTHGKALKIGTFFTMDHVQSIYFYNKFFYIKEKEQEKKWKRREHKFFLFSKQYWMYNFKWELERSHIAESVSTTELVEHILIKFNDFT